MLKLVVSENMASFLGTLIFVDIITSKSHGTFMLDTGKFTLEGADNVGIVHKVTSILANNGLSIEKMETSDEMAPYGGTTLFRMMGIAHAYQPVSAGFDAEKVKAELEKLGEDLNCNIDMTDLSPGETDLGSA